MSFKLTGSPEFTYTAQPDGGEIASEVIGLFGITVMCALFGIKTYNVQYRYLSYSRWLVLLLYMCSWAFTVTGLTLMITNNGELTCDIFYSGTKILMYCWLIEKVWVVNAGRTSRWQTKSYRFHVLLLTPYIAIFSLMIIFHNAWLLDDGICIIGLKPIASIPLIAYDFIFNLYMTVLFVLPLMKIGNDTNMDWKQSRLREVAKRTMLASVVCLVASFANVTALAILDGTERGVVCLTCCFVDVMVNVVTVHWVTSQPSGRTTRDTVLGNPLSGGSSGNPYEDETLNKPSKPTLTPTTTTTPTPTIATTVNGFPTDKKKRFRFDPVNQQYGEFGAAAWPAEQQQQQTNDYNANHYMSATNNQIYTSPATATDYHHQLPAYQPSSTATSHVPYHFMNGRFVMVSERDDDDFQTTSRSSSVQESHSSKKSLTKIPSNASSYYPH
ncbi:hypothetical protein [Absidia glauca]|uniref:Uncharacterized protein n=1 Tax=Absidia glauca TaxID=4829 RepID=A0A168KUP5_ABSGL|nr:hypothetical protein [Absidia glauca]